MSKFFHSIVSKFAFQAALPVIPLGVAFGVLLYHHRAALDVWDFRIAGLAVFCTALLLTYATYSAYRSIWNPLRVLRSGVSHLGREEYDHPVVIKGRDEFAELGKLLEKTRMQLKRAHERELHLNTLKSQFVSLVAHQLRTPLTSLRWSLEEYSAKDREVNPQDVKRALGRTLYMIDMVNELLDVSRIEEGRFQYEMRERLLGPDIIRVMRDMMPRMNEKDLTFVFDEDAFEQFPILSIDGEKILMVISNVVDNAIKYTPKGGTVHAWFISGAESVQIMVEDSGIGIPQNELHNITTKFYRAKNAIEQHTVGSGLGLFVSKEIIAAHSGDLLIESKENVGTRVTITLPKKG